jgi:single-strand DNA-binding protein
MTASEPPNPQFQVSNLTGRLTAGPGLHDRAGTQVGRLRLAIGRPRGNDGGGGGADCLDVSTFARQAEVCDSYLAKGRRVAVSGRLRHSERGAETGSCREKVVEVVAERVELLDQPQRRRRPRPPGGPGPPRRRRRPKRGRPSRVCGWRGARCGGIPPGRPRLRAQQERLCQSR